VQATIYDFDMYLRRQLEPKFGNLGQVARHKLLYAVHRLAIAKTNRPAFVARCEAWPMGPVFTELYFNPSVTGNAEHLTPDQKSFCDLVAQILGAQSGRSLAARSHCRYPEWRDAKRKRINKEITLDAIKEQLFRPRL
jgi:uncharacterized phage-associated protein